MKIALFIATEKGYACLKKMIDCHLTGNIGFVSVFKETNVTKGYDEEIVNLCKLNGIKLFYWKEIKNNLINVVKDEKIDAAFTVSWRFLIDIEINNYMKYGLVVFHDSLLPKFRGFAPTPTAILCGETKTGITAIYASKGVDEGDIILQREIALNDNDYIEDVIHKEAYVCSDMVIEIINSMMEGKCVSYKQDNTKATYSIWRNVEDCRINWKCSSKEIRDLIRAVSSPYPGAFFYYNSKKVIVNRAEILPEMFFEFRQPGKIWSINDNCPVVICGKGMLKITGAAYEDGTPVIFEYLRRNLSDIPNDKVV